MVVREGTPGSTSEIVTLALAGSASCGRRRGTRWSRCACWERSWRWRGRGCPSRSCPGVGARGRAAAFAGLVGTDRRASAGEVARVVEREPREAVVTLIAAAGEPSQRVIVTTAGEAPARARSIAEAELWWPWAPRRRAAVVRAAAALRQARARDRAREAQATGRGQHRDLLGEEGAEPVVVPTVQSAARRSGAARARGGRASRRRVRVGRVHEPTASSARGTRSRRRTATRGCSVARAWRPSGRPRQRRSSGTP